MGRGIEADKRTSGKAEPRNSLRTAKTNKETENIKHGQEHWKINPNVPTTPLTDLQKDRDHEAGCPGPGLESNVPG